MEPNDLGVTIPKTSVDAARGGLERIARFRTADLDRLTEQVKGLRSAKFDAYVPESVLRRFWSRRQAAVISEIPQIAAECAMQKVPGT